MPTDILRPQQVAEMFNVHASTVMRWADDGKLPHFLTPGGQRRFRREDVEAFIATAPAAERAS